MSPSVSHFFSSFFHFYLPGLRAVGAEEHKSEERSTYNKNIFIKSWSGNFQSSLYSLTVLVSAVLHKCPHEHPLVICAIGHSTGGNTCYDF